MLSWWLATISLSGFLITSIALVIYALKSSLNSEDAYKIDPIPSDDEK